MKRATAAALILALCLGLCSCGYNPAAVGKIVSADGTEYEIGCGRYLIAQFTAADSAVYTYDPSGSTGLSDILDKQLEGKDVRQWIADKTQEILLRAQAVDEIYEKNGFALGADKLYVYEYSIGYGWSSYRDLYLRNGISYESYYAGQMNMAKDVELPSMLYKNGGPEELPASEVQAYLDTKAARISMIELPAVPETVSLSGEQTALLDSLAAQLAEEARTAGLAAAVEKFTPAYEELLGEGCLKDLLKENELVLEGDGVLSSADYASLLALAEGEVLCLDRGDHAHAVIRRGALQADDTPDNVREKVVDILGSGLGEEYLAQALKGWRIEYDAKAVKYYSLDKVTFG